MPRCQICGADHEGVKEVKVVVRSFFNTDLSQIEPGSDIIPFSELDKSRSDVRSFFICRECARWVHGLLTEDENFPYKGIPDAYVTKFFYDTYLSRFFALHRDVETEECTSRGFCLVDYATSNNDLEYNGIHNYNSNSYIQDVRNYSDIKRSSYNSSFYDVALNVVYNSCNYNVTTYVSSGVCNECGDTVPLIDLIYNDHISEYVCYDCNEEINERNEEDQYDGDYEDECENNTIGPINDYGYKPIPIFYKVDKSGEYDIATVLHKIFSEPYFGVELEVDTPSGNRKYSDAINEDAQHLMDTIDNFNDMYYIKHDGSLNAGMEIVSHPMTLKYHLEKAPWSQILKECVSMGYRSNDVSTCGLHIHISKNSLGSTYEEVSDVMYKMILFTEILWEDFKKFSRRRDMSYCSKYDSYTYKDTFKTFKDKVANKAFRNAAVNITSRHTVELRLIKGTLNEVTFRAALQFAFLLRILSMGLTDKAITNSTFQIFKDSAEIFEFTDFLKYCEIRGL